MEGLLRAFGEIAVKLARNPIGIIALFICLIYGIASLSLVTTAESLTSGERLPLIWLITIFPFAVLITFFRLVSVHHRKLYAPSDFQDEDNFVLLSGGDPKKEELEIEELDYIEMSSDQSMVHVQTDGKIPERAMSFKTDCTVAAELVLQDLQERYGIKFKREFAAIANDQRFYVDGLYSSLSKTIAVEVKLIPGPTIHRKRVKQYIEQLDKIRKNLLNSPFSKNIRIIFALVTTVEPINSDVNAIVNQISKYMTLSKVQADVVIYYLSEGMLIRRWPEE